MFIFIQCEVKNVCSSKTTSNNLIPHSHYELEGIHWEKVLKEEFIPTYYPFGMKHKMHALKCNNHYPLYKISWYIKIL